MVKIGLIQTKSYPTNEKGITIISNKIRELGKKEIDIVCLPEQWLKNNLIDDGDKEFLEFKKIAKEFTMTIIPGAFFNKMKKNTHIISPVIGPEGEFIGKQEKIHPFDDEKNKVKPGNEVKIFNTTCKFGIIICYDMVFPNVANTLVKKGAQILFSPSRIVRRGIEPWKMYVQVRALENRVPIVASNVESKRFGGNSMIVDLSENYKVMKTQILQKNGEGEISKKINLKKYIKSRKIRFSDSNKFQ